jgi:rsbT co-antagonist protein RsbR
MGDERHRASGEESEEIERLRRRVADLEQAAEERNRLRDELKRSDELVRLFVTYTPAAVAMFDMEVRYLMASLRWKTEYRLDQEIIGRSHYEVFPEVPERWKEIHRRCLAGATESCEEDPFPRADGTLDWVRWKIYPWHKLDGEIGGIIMFTEVVTNRKNLEDKLKSQAVALQDLSMPIIPINEQILVMPLIGTMDPERTEQMMNHLLQQIAATRARIAILDVTGVPHVDTGSANALIQIAGAVRMLGAQVVLTGISPEVATAMIRLDVDIGRIVTRRDLQSGIAFAMGTP